jgi:hypothetical protein
VQREGVGARGRNGSNNVCTCEEMNKKVKKNQKYTNVPPTS